MAIMVIQDGTDASREGGGRGAHPGSTSAAEQTVLVTRACVRAAVVTRIQDDSNFRLE